MRSPAWDDWVAKARAVRIEDEIARRGIKLNGGSVERCGSCPRCGGDDRFSINTTKQVFNCRGCGIKGDVIGLVETLDKIDFSHAVEMLTGEPSPKAANGERTNKDATQNGSAWTFIREHIYQDRNSAPYLLVKVFMDEHGKKQCPQFHWDGATWEKGKPVGPKIPYRLPELLAAPIGTTIYIVEGEKCAEALARRNFIATTNSEGAARGGKDDAGKKWTPELNAYFKGYNVVLIGDNDAAGRRHVRYVAKQLQGVAESIRVVDLAEHWPSGNMPEGDDVADFLEQYDLAGSKLAKLCKEAPLWEPSADDAKDDATSDEAGSDDKDGDEDDDKQVIRKKQADMLVEFASAANLFHTSARDAYADVMVGSHRETYRVRSKAFRSWLLHRYFEAYRGAPNSEAMQSALNVIEARALFEGPEIEVHLRVAEHEGKVYLDLADHVWRAVEIDADDWRIVSSPPVRFKRVPGMLRLPEPVRGRSINALRSLLNVQSDADFVLAVAWLLAALRGRGPYPALVLSGEQGTAKSSFCGMLRALIDPNTAPLRALPREDRDLFIAANNGHVLAFDNVSGLPAWISDTLCRLATGGGFSVRQLYSDDAEMLFDAVRPTILNGIEDVVTRPDLVDRAILLTLETIPEDKRRPEKELWAELYQERPRLLGALLDVVVHGLRELPKVRLSKLPRMADFAMWAVACETALWPAGTFAAAYEANREDAIGGTIEADLVATAVRAFMANRTTWEGTASQLLDALGQLITDTQRRSKNWPAFPNHLTGRLRRAAPALRRVRIEVEFRREMRARTIRITHGQPEEEGNSSSLSSSSSLAHKSSDLDMTLANGPTSSSCPPWNAPGADGHDDHYDPQGSGIVMANTLKESGNDDHDAHDDHFPNLSGDAPRCDHCGSQVGITNPYDWPGRPDGIRLHPWCEGPWFDSEGRPQ